MKLSALWGVYYVLSTAQLIVPLTAEPWGTDTIILLLQRMSWGSERFTYLPKSTRQRSDSTMIHTLLPAQNPCFLSSSPLGLAAMLRSPNLGLWAERPGGWWVRAKVARCSSGRLCPAMEHGLMVRGPQSTRRLECMCLSSVHWPPLHRVNWLAHLRPPCFVVASCDLATVPGSKSFITLHLLFCQSSELVHFIDDKENLESSGKSPIKMTKLFLVCSFTD